jgi:hypothetical protein
MCARVKVETSRMTANANPWGLVLEPLTEKRGFWAGCAPNERNLLIEGVELNDFNMHLLEMAK